MPGLDTSKWLTTPVGAVIGLAVARRGIPKSMRGRVSDAVGLIAGSGAGYAGGEALDDVLRRRRTTTAPGFVSEYSKMSPRQLMESPGKEEMTQISQIMSDVPAVANTEFAVKMLKRIQPMLAEHKAWAFRVAMIRKMKEKGVIPVEKMPEYHKAMLFSEDRAAQAAPTMIGNVARGALEGVIKPVGSSASSIAKEF